MTQIQNLKRLLKKLLRKHSVPKTERKWLMIQSASCKPCKLPNGKWVYGYLCNKNCIFSPELEGELLVDPETICRCTGKTDQNARDIFEKDICIIHSTSIDEEDGLFVVEWNSDSAKFELSGWGIMTDFENQNGYECEIIGNIYDNPELVKGECE